MSIFQGDPKLIFDKNGLDLVFKDGQPVMDNGLENFVLISLGTDEGWIGNFLIQNTWQNILDGPDIGSRFGKSLTEPITIDSLDNVRVEAEAALDSPVIGNVEVDINNPVSSRLDIQIKVSPPGDIDSFDFLLSKDGLNWAFQRNDPAHERI